MILLGLGSNLSSSFGDRFKNIDLAISGLNGYGIHVKKKSSYYESLSYPNKDNPKFIDKTSWLPEIYQIGIRNVQGMCLSPFDNNIYMTGKVSEVKKITINI